jgi:uncharacterized membrane protein YkoI
VGIAGRPGDSHPEDAMRQFISCVGAAALAAALLAPAVRADETVPLDKVPKAVTDAIKARWPDAELPKNAVAIKEIGDTKKSGYELEIKNKNDELEVTLTEAGDIVQFERELEVKDLPKAVVKALEDKYPKAELKEADEVTKVDGKKEKLAYYVVEVKTADKKTLEVQVDPDGKVLKSDEEKPAAKEEKIPLDKVPDKVMAAIKDRFAGADVTSAEKETEDGQVVYDIELTHKDRKYEMDIKEDGTILEIEKEVAAKDVPDAVKKAVEGKYPKATIKEVMEVNKVKDKTETPVNYEVVIVAEDKKEIELVVSLDGKTVTEEK